jgi:AraC-like DNA-binding protein
MKSIQEFVEINGDHPIRISVFESLKLKHPFHYHASEYELTLTLGSSGLRLVGDSIEEFGETDLVMIGPGTPHCWLNNFTNGNEDQEYIRVVVIHFNENIFSEELLKRQELDAIRYLLHTAKRGIAYHGSVREKIKNEILRLKIDPDFGTWVSLYSIFNDLSQSPEYNYLAGRQYNFEGKKEEVTSFEKVHTYILENYREKIRIGEVASIIGMNESAFSHYFKKRTLKSYTDFINELRLNYAANLLSNTRKNVAEIAFESGFNNLSNFNRIFKKWKGRTPNQWRRKTEPLPEPVS